MSERYLLDRMVVMELEGEGGDRRVRAWRDTVEDRDLYLPAVVIYEATKGLARRRRAKLSEEEARLLAEDEADVRAIIDGFGDRIAGIGKAEASRWGELVGAKEKNTMDRAIAAIAIEGGFVLVTRNRKDFVGLPLRLLDPFVEGAIIEPNA